ncbi:MAG: hypothetical protein Q9170_000460 [Blastenia crenularia]
MIPPSQSFNNSLTAPMNADDMDMDIDIDLGPADVPDATTVPTQSTSNKADIPNTIDPPKGDAVAHKIHIRGVDDLTTDDLKIFVDEHHSEAPIRIEWVDDFSANLVYGTPATAMKALESLSLVSLGQIGTAIPILQLRSAKNMSDHPESRLQVRIALSTDVKRPHAYEASRFYMMHPEYDPRENVRRQKDGDGRHIHQRRRYGDTEDRRRPPVDRERRYAADMYDDDSKSVESSGPASRRSSTSMMSNGSAAVDTYNGQAGHRRASQRGDFYRPSSKRERRSPRTRSASPSQGRHSHFTSDRRHARQCTPPDNRGKELFQNISGAAMPSPSSKELFRNKSIAANLKELFPAKKSSPHHRRSDAFDAAEDTADLFAAGMEFSAGDPAPPNTTTAVDPSYGRLRSSDPEPRYDPHESPLDLGMSIRGASKHQDRGVSILGAAQKSHMGTIRELFPDRATNVGKELFAERLEGRNLRRNKAEDLFY